MITAVYFLQYYFCPCNLRPVVCHRATGALRSSPKHAPRHGPRIVSHWYHRPQPCLYYHNTVTSCRACTAEARWVLARWGQTGDRRPLLPVLLLQDKTGTKQHWHLVRPQTESKLRPREWICLPKINVQIRPPHHKRAERRATLHPSYAAGGICSRNCSAACMQQSVNTARLQPLWRNCCWIKTAHSSRTAGAKRTSHPLTNSPSYSNTFSHTL